MTSTEFYLCGILIQDEICMQRRKPFQSLPFLSGSLLHHDGEDSVLRGGVSVCS